MKYGLLLFCFCLCFSFACSEKIKDEFILSGNFESDNFNDSYVYLTKINEDLVTFTDLDSALVSDRKFLFRGKAIKKVLEARYVFTGISRKTDFGRPVKMFIPEEGRIYMTIDEDGCPTVSGSVNNSKLNDLQQVFISAYKMSKSPNTNLGDPEPQISALEMIRIAKDMNGKAYSFLNEIKDNPLFEEVYIIYTPFLSINQRRSLNEYFGVRLTNKIVSDLERRSEIGNMKIGEQFFELNCLDLDNNRVKLSSYINKNEITLIDFWASWCGPCINEIPHLKKIYEKYSRAGFAIVSISIDQDRNEWLKSVAKQDMPWTQLLSKQGKESAMIIYGFNGIPYTLLVDKKGKALAKNIRGKQIEVEIEKLLNNGQK